MQFSLFFFTLLCCASWMSFSQATHGPSVTCCRLWSKTRVRLNQVLNYTIQHESPCPIPAVMFLTVRKRTICSDPDSKWTKSAMSKVDKETQELLERGEIEGKLTSVVPPVISGASKNPPGRRPGKMQKRKNKRRKQNKRQRKQS